MKILFVTSSGVGHVQPVIGLALAARERGHEIAWVTARDAAPLLAAQSIHVFDAGASLVECRAEYFKRWPDAAQHTGRNAGPHAFPRLFSTVIANSMLPGLEHAVAEWKPDLIVNETGAVVAPLVARKFGIPHVTHAFGLPMPASTLHASREAIAPLWYAAGFEVPEFCGLYDHAGIEISAPSLQAACPNPCSQSARYCNAPHRSRPHPQIDYLNRYVNFWIHARAHERDDRSSTSPSAPSSIKTRALPLRSTPHQK